MSRSHKINPLYHSNLPKPLDLFLCSILTKFWYFRFFWYRPPRIYTSVSLPRKLLVTFLASLAETLTLKVLLREQFHFQGGVVRGYADQLPSEISVIGENY